MGQMPGRCEMKSVIRKLGGLILGVVLLSGVAVSANANPFYWHRHYRVYYTRPVYHRYVYYPHRYVYYYPRGYYARWHRHHHYWWHHRDWD
jgi:hypothetical protein